MAPTVVHLQPGDVPRLRTLGLSSSHPVVAVFGSTAALAPELGAALAPSMRALLQAAADHDAVVVTGGTDSGIFHLLGTCVAGVQPTPLLVGVAPAGRIRSTPSSDDGDGLAGIEPHHRTVVLAPGARWGDETGVLSLLVSAVSKDLIAVGVLVGGGDVTRVELREHLSRGRPVIVLRGSGRLADEVADGSLRSGEDGDLAALVAAGDIRVVDVVHGPAALVREVEGLLGPVRRRGLRARVPAMAAWPRWRAVAAPLTSLIGRDPVDEYPALRGALQAADRVVVPALRESDAIAQREQNRHRWYVTLGLIGGLATTTLGAVQSWLVSAAWPGVAVATVGAATSGLLTVSRRQGSLDAYVVARTRAERLRSLCFEFLSTGPMLGEDESRARLADLREETARRQYGLGSGPAPAAAAPQPTAPAPATQAPAPAPPRDPDGDGSAAWREQLLDLYRRHRIDEQATWYAERTRQYESALRTTVTVSAVLLVFAAFFGALGTADAARRPQWAVCAATCGALAAAANTYEAMSGFGRLSREYAKMVASLRLAHARSTAVESLGAADLRDFIAETERLVLGEVTSWSLLLRQADDGTQSAARTGSSESAAP